MLGIGTSLTQMFLLGKNIPGLVKQMRKALNHSLQLLKFSILGR